MKTDPRTGCAYEKDAFNADAVDTLLCLVDVRVPIEVIRGWTPEQLQTAGDWAVRSHLRASDNSTRVGRKPAHVDTAELDAQIAAIENPHQRKVARLAADLRNVPDWRRDAFPKLVEALVECYRNEVAELQAKKDEAGK
jgi:hypothetical protein